MRQRHGAVRSRATHIADTSMEPSDSLYSSQVDVEPVPATEIGRGSVTDGSISSEGLGIAAYAATIRPVAIVDVLPTLPDADYPELSYAVLTTDDRLYKNIGEVWVLGVDGADIVAESITAGRIAAGAIGTTQLAVGAWNTSNLLKNGDFEEGLTAYGTTDLYLPGWSRRSSTEYGFLTSVNARSGTHISVFRSTTGLSAPGITQTVNVIPGRTYRLSGWLWKAVAGGQTNNLRMTTLDASGGIVAAAAILLHTSTTGTPTYVEGTYTIPDDGTVSAVRIEVVAGGNPLVAEIFASEDVTLELIPAGARNTTGSVLIDENGIVIKDSYSEAVLTAAGFAGSWSDFISLGLYNARFLFGTAGALTLGSTSLPYWVSSAPSGSPTLTKLAGSGVEVKFSNVGDILRLESTFVPVHQGAWYQIPVYGNINAVGGSFPTYSIIVSWYDDTSTIISTVTHDTGIGTHGLHEPPLIEAPTTAHFAKVRLNVTEGGLHSAAAYYRFYSVAFLRAPQENLAGYNLVADALTVTDAVLVSSGGIFEAGGRVIASAIISPTALAATTNDWLPTGFPDCFVIRVGTDATPRTLTGLADGDSGQVIWLHNRNSSTTLTLAHDSASSTAAMRFFCPGAVNYALTGKSSVMLIYSITDSRWLVMG